MPNSVTPIMPLNTAVPSDRRISAPAPVATIRGTTPMMKANEVITIGRIRSRDASRAASKRGLPSLCSCWANSTTRMAFLHASPTSTTRPIRTKMSRAPPVAQPPSSEQSTHSGTTRMTASGIVQLSYRAARARKTQSTASPKTYRVVSPSWIWRYISSVHSVPIPSGSFLLASSFTLVMISPVLYPFLGLPMTAAAV